jgi:hypothetical protein
MSRIEKALLIQPPFTQLNAPYPAVWYLDAWLRERGIDSTVADHSIATMRAMLCERGVRRAFELAKARIAERGMPAREVDAAEVARYLSDEERWIHSVPAYARALSSGDPELLSLIATSRPFAYGRRAQAVADSRDARSFASRALADWADFLGFAVDGEFSISRYAESIASSVREFDPVLRALDGSVVLPEWYGPMLSEWLDRFAPAGRFLLCASVPFPGTLVGALYACREAKRRFGDRAVVALGGGYVSTELRGLSDPRLFDFCDYLCFDAGFGALASIVDIEEGANGVPYRAMRRSADGSGIEACSLARLPTDAPDDGRVARLDAPDAARYAAEDARALREVHPDYRGLDAKAYLPVAESGNAMHDLWSSATWIKQRLAYGCYWRKCSFCDTELDYVKGYRKVNVARAFEATSRARAETGLSGVHFTDEAMPAAALAEFARLARREGRPLPFWGNVRYDRSWTQDLCAFLADSGLIAVSGGLESPTERGLALAGKGSTLEDMIGALVAFKSAGVMTHGYLMYGLPGQDDRDIADSAEVARQLFACGLLDSAFWHRFVLTRHSAMNRERLEGLRPGLRAIDGPFAFASNDLRVEGDSRYDEWDGILDALLAEWSRGDGLDAPIRVSIRGKQIAARTPPDLVESRCEKALSLPPSASGRAYWLGGAIMTGDGRLSWAHGAELAVAEGEFPSDEAAEKIARLIDPTPPRRRDEWVASTDLEAAAERIVPGIVASDAWRCLRERGLCYV